jgi:hypothetical protein
MYKYTYIYIYIYIYAPDAITRISHPSFWCDICTLPGGVRGASNANRRKEKGNAKGTNERGETE